ncbi:hypothetical protein [Cryobacterium sp.]|jgi:hypothetical protein|uniref:PepSY domain-containing protein n=1 Tax=Cryobacterium sp. TaxID=1926290 RepID=UPI002625EE54|nr:hypothetical protein [Cryobacterium sp.]MCU1445619.1 hypothetical protein [Cryobacterium sp.]
MNRTSRLTVTGGAIIGAVILVGGSIAANADGQGEDAPETAITGSAFDRASAAALAHAGEGRVTGTEIGDEESYYEVEVTLDDGTEVDVQLDKGFAVVDAAPDNPTDD